MAVMNQDQRLSATGRYQLGIREGAIFHYYNDPANNCTYGIGALVHLGPCTQEELHRPVSPQQVTANMERQIRVAEQVVRRGVTERELTQARFDARVSFAYNVGVGGAQATLTAANRGDWSGVARHIHSNVFIYPRDAQGLRLRPVRSRGLENRRREEAKPFEAGAAQ